MEFLLLAISCSVMVAHLLKYAGSRSMDMPAIFAINYLIGSLIALSGTGWNSAHIFLSTEYVLLGILMGGLFIGTFFIYSTAIKRCGLAVAVALMRIAAVLPTLGSIVLFGESPGVLQIAGITLAFIALPYSQSVPVQKKDLTALRGSALQWGLLLFLSFGVTEFLFKLQKEWYPHQNPYAFLSIVFPTAAIIGIIVAVRIRKPPTGKALIIGLLLGTVNMFSAYFFYRALTSLPGIIAYPTNGIGVILLTLATGFFIWKEHLSRRQILFFLLAAFSLVLMYQ